ncbi:hypothetical protein ACWD4F_08950, partial [Streptomyces aureus]
MSPARRCGAARLPSARAGAVRPPAERRAGTTQGREAGIRRDLLDTALAHARTAADELEKEGPSSGRRKAG